jgi:uncharacterized membrane-anchored protein YjiN (DUF445 family)
VYLVENEWLKAEIINEKIKNYGILDKGYSLLQSEEGRERLQAIVTSIISSTIDNIKPEQMAEFIEKIIKKNFKKVKLNPDFVHRLEKSVKELYIEDFIDFLIVGAKDVLKTQEFVKITQNALRKAAEDYSSNTFFRRLSRGIGEKFDILNYGEAAESINKKLQEILIIVKMRMSFSQKIICISNQKGLKDFLIFLLSGLNIMNRDLLH